MRAWHDLLVEIWFAKNANSGCIDLWRTVCVWKITHAEVIGLQDSDTLISHCKKRSNLSTYAMQNRIIIKVDRVERPNCDLSKLEVKKIALLASRLLSKMGFESVQGLPIVLQPLDLWWWIVAHLEALSHICLHFTEKLHSSTFKVCNLGSN